MLFEITDIHMSNEIKKLRILSENNEDWLFHDQYVIPLYQRVYTWSTEKEILGLLDAINAIDIEEESSNKKNYWLGVLSVIPQKNEEYGEYYEVVDGQQRLTTIYLLLKALSKWDLSEEHKSSGQEKQEENPFKDAEGKLRFDFRNSANETLKTPNKEDPKDTGISNGFDGILDWINKNIGDEKNDREKFLKNLKKFLEKLERVSVYRVSLPKKIDPCKYFMRLNSRGKQLELVDILKARLISTVGKNPKNQDFFAGIWEACSRMDVYIQETIGKEIWGALFDKNWENDLPTTLTEELKKNLKRDANSANDDENLKSIINFPTFLMHVLKLCALNKNIEENSSKETTPTSSTSSDTQKKDLSQAATDDSKLVSYFKDYWECAFGSTFTNRKSEEVIDFFRTMFHARYLFDGWIVKRQLKDDEPFGWAIKHEEWKLDEDEREKKFSRVNSFNSEHERIEMLQSCLRVTYTSPSSMPWITKLLKRLWELSFKEPGNNNPNNPNSQGIDVLDFLEKYSCERVAEEIKGVEGYKKYEDVSQGTATPRILFNFLDYLLWRDHKKWDDVLPNTEKEGVNNFKFSYLSSVEHWYPQNPEDGKRWENVDQFGNLFLIGGGENSSLSNASFTYKKSKIKKWVTKRNISLKGLHMYAMTGEEKDWTDSECKELGEEHYQMLVDEIEAKLKHS